MGRLFLCALLFVLASICSPPALADKRVALVIGNTDYRHVAKLPNAANDAKLLADTLESAGFTLIGKSAQLDLDKQAFERALRQFREGLVDADVGLFYYAGHGIQVEGVNWLVPIDANVTHEADVDLMLLNVNSILRQMEAARTRLNIVVLDACRNDPFSSGRGLVVARGRDSEAVRLRDITTGRGLAQMQVPADTLLAFATQPGSVAQDGTGANSPYAKALAETIRKPGLGILEMFNEVGLQVRQATRGAQLPWASNSPLSYPFQFAPPAGTAAAPVAPVLSAEENAWNDLKDTVQTEALRRFVARYPRGAYTRDAEARIAALEQAAAPVQRVQPERGKATVPVKVLSPENESALKPQDAFKECDTCPEMIPVPPGTFVMGSPTTERAREAAEGPQQQVVFRRMFAVGRSAVTFEEWNACVAEGGCNHYRPGDYGWGGGKRPVINVSWDDAQIYVKWLSDKTGAEYRLLSEAEREYVTRGCLGACPSTPFWFGAEISPARANYDWRFSYDGSAKGQPARRTIATDAPSEPNPFGLVQVHGNVREWVEDCWNPTLAGLPRDGTARITGDCSSRVVRGGSWADDPKDLRSAKRSWELANERRAQIGFRVARTLRN